MKLAITGRMHTNDGKREILTTEDSLPSWDGRDIVDLLDLARLAPNHFRILLKLKTGPSVQLLKKVGRMDAGCQVVGRPRRDR